jgi:hypothetical protein
VLFSISPLWRDDFTTGDSERAQFRDAGPAEGALRGIRIVDDEHSPGRSAKAVDSVRERAHPNRRPEAKGSASRRVVGRDLPGTS